MGGIITLSGVDLLTPLRVGRVPDEIGRNSCKHYREHQKRAARLIRQRASGEQCTVVTEVVTQAVSKVLDQRVPDQKDHGEDKENRRDRITPRSISAWKIRTFAAERKDSGRPARIKGPYCKHKRIGQLLECS